MNSKKYNALNIAVVVILVMALLAVYFVLSGMFRKDPVVGITADNCYEDTIYVITDADYRPYSFYDGDGNPSGHDIELIALIANKLNMNLDLKLMDWDEGIKEVTSGKAQVLMTADYSDTFAGTDVLIKTDPTASDDYLVYSKHNMSSADDLYGTKIAVMKNGNVNTQIDMLQLGKYCTYYENNRTAMKAVLDGEADCAVMRGTVGSVLLDELGDKSAEPRFSVGQSFMCFDVNPEYPELAEKINNAIEELKKDGELAELREKWLTTFIHDYSVREIIEKYPLLMLGFLLIIIIVFAGLTYSIRKNLLIREDEIRAELEYRKSLEQYQKELEAANKSKTDFLFNMSHDIRTPMNAIIGFTNLAKKHVDDKEKTEDYLDKIEFSGRHLLNLINDVLDMSRVEAGKIKSELKAVNIIEVAESLITVYRESAAERNIKLSYINSGVRDANVFADELHINQILMNVLGNAIKYTMPGGSVVLTVDQGESDNPEYGRYLFTVEDTGIGMSEKFAEKIFESFSREETATVSNIQGTGLGMSIVKRLVDFLDGTIEIKSQQGKGTKVVLGFSLKPAGESALKAVSSESGSIDLSGRKVLLAEDNDLNREICVEILGDEGMSVETVVNGLEAVDAVRNKGTDYYDIVLMDIQMPFKNGYEATEEIRKLPGAEKLVIVALSANAFEEDRKKSLEAGMDDHVAKPINIQVLKGTLAKYL